MKKDNMYEDIPCIWFHSHRSLCNRNLDNCKYIHYPKFKGKSIPEKELSYYRECFEVIKISKTKEIAITILKNLIEYEEV